MDGTTESEPLVVDVTTEMIGERREEYHAGFDSGLRQGATRVLQSDALGQLALSLRVHKALNEAMCDVAHQRETLLAHWKAEAQWWREEHDRVSAEYSAFVKEMARRLAPK